MTSQNWRKLSPYKWELPRTGNMKVPGIVYASEGMLPKPESEKAAEQVRNVAELRGITKASLAMPDAHWGYGFPIGGVAAMSADEGVISPGGVGYDISCGVRLLRSNLFAASVKNKISAAMDLIFSLVPSGVGSVGKIKLNEREIKKVLESGARWAVENSFGAAEDLDFCEDIGALKDADCQALSPRAIERGLRQLGTLGSGNHFIELEQVAEIFDETTAQNFGLFKGQLVALIHTGSRGLGYQVCEDFVKLMLRSLQKYNIQLPDRQLACAPINSDEGKLYLGAMRSAANYAKANRQVITHYVREALMRAFSIGPADLGMDVVYDISHNIAKMERHIVDGKESNYCVHRKGATRAFAAGNAEIPARYRAFGQPILVPGSMGTSSYVLVGTKQAEQETFASVCHGAGRAMSRSQALKSVSGHELIKQLSSMNIEVRTDSLRTLGEEAPQAYKDISEVVEVCVGAGLAKKVARMLPLGVVKG